MQDEQSRERLRKWRALHPGYQARKDSEYYHRNLEKCRRIGREKWQNATPETKAHRRKVMQANHLKRKYNLTPEDKENMFEKQRGLCYLCNRPLFSCAQSVVEHNHYTDEIRGLAHKACNTRLGQIEKLWHDDPDTLQRMLNTAGVPMQK